MRKQPCKYCGMQMESLFLEAHETKCSTRTVLCEQCNTYVQLGSLEHHQLSKCSGALMAEEELTFTCPFCTFSLLPEEDLITHLETAHHAELDSEDLICPICLLKEGTIVLEKKLGNFRQHLEWHYSILLQKKKHRNNRLPGTGLPKLHYFEN